MNASALSRMQELLPQLSDRYIGSGQFGGTPFVGPGVQLANQRPEALSILAGDLNAVPSSEPLGLLRQAWQLAGDGQEHPTFPADNPRRQLDYILFRPEKRWKVSEFRVLDEGAASNHRPVLAVLELL